VRSPGNGGTAPTSLSFHGNYMSGNSQDFVTLGPGIKISGNR
jgi:hypothetical protein